MMMCDLERNRSVKRLLRRLLRLMMTMMMLLVELDIRMDLENLLGLDLERVIETKLEKIEFP